MGAGNDKGGAAKRQRWASTTWPDVQTLVQRLSRRPLTHFYTSFSPSSTRPQLCDLFVSSFLQLFHLNENLMITAVTRSSPEATSTHYRYADPGLNCGQVQCNPWPHVETVEIVETPPHHWSAPSKSGAGLVGWSEGG